MFGKVLNTRLDQVIRLGDDQKFFGDHHLFRCNQKTHLLTDVFVNLVAVDQT